MREAPSARKDEPPATRLLGNVLKVAVLVLLLVLLYLAVISSPTSPSPVERVDVIVGTSGTNWTVQFRAVPLGKLPTELFVVLRHPSGGIGLARTTLADLPGANWSRVLVAYEKANPGVGDVQPGDRLLIDRGAYLAGSALDVSDDRSVLAIETLR